MGIALTADQKSALRRDASIYGAEGGDLPQDLEDLQNQIDTGPAAGSVTAAMLYPTLADLLVKVSWGTPGAEAADEIEVRLQLLDIQGNSLAAEHVFLIHVADTEDGDDSATAVIEAGSGAAGTILAGSGSAVVRVETDTNGRVDLKVTEAATASRYLAAAPTFRSPHLDCSASCALTFA